MYQLKVMCIQSTYEGWLKSSEADQMEFIFQHSPPCSSHTSINAAVLGSY